MPAASTRTICVICNQEKITYPCHGCSENYCFIHLTEHRNNLGEQLNQIGNDHDEFRQNLNNQKANSTEHSLIKQINQWENDSIDKIKQIAHQCREKLINCKIVGLHGAEKKLNDLAEQIKEIRQENEFNEIDINHLKQRLQKIQEELLRSSDVSIEQQSTLFINKISVRIPFHKDTRWEQLGITIAGGNGRGDRLDQLSCPYGISLDEKNQTIYIADIDNARIVEWISNETNGRIMAGGNGKGDQNNQLNDPSDVNLDTENNSLIIADSENRRVMRWSRLNNSHGQIIISNIDCIGLTIHKDGFLYVSDFKKNDVTRWKKGEINGTIVAGGNGQGNQLNQLHFPTSIFVDDDQTLYISDGLNHRVMKWMKDGKEGIIVAGGNGRGDHVTQLSSPRGVIVDQFGQIYVADSGNNRVMRWCEGAKEGTIVVGGNERGKQANQLNLPMGLSFDGERNLYVADWNNSRIQKFVVD